MEADFQREYALDLSTALRTLSWRRFMVLLRGLGPNSATAVHLRARRYGQPGSQQRSTAAVPVVTGKANVARYLSGLYGGAPGQPRGQS